MNKKKTIFVIVIIIFIVLVEGINIIKIMKHTVGYFELGYVLHLQNNKTDLIGDDTLSHKSIVAHAGGHADSLIYTNTLDALNDSYYRGIRFFEIDFEWTSDNQLVCIHDWEQNWEKYFNKNKIPNCETFLQTKMKHNLRQMDIGLLVTWLKNHDDCYIITDVKRKNLSALEKIKNEYPEIIKNIIPQIYWFYEYNYVMEMGYKRVILTLYRSNYWDSQVVTFIKHYKVFAVTMTQERASSSLPFLLSSHGVFVYAHTINSMDEFTKLKNNCINGVYSDFL